MVSDSGSRYPDTIKDFKFAEDIATLPFSSGTTGKSNQIMDLVMVDHEISKYFLFKLVKILRFANSKNFSQRESFFLLFVKV